MNLLLLSNSTAPGRTYLEHARDAVLELLGDRREVVFIPYALADHDAYTAQVAGVLEPLGIAVRGVHDGDPAALLSGAQAIYVGGGNTFRLLLAMQRLDLLDVVREAVRAGTPYLGSSAGTNLACPTIQTTNDMPIVAPTSFEALGLVPFQINAHYVDPDPASTHQGETREERIVQYLEENPGPVLGLREGAWVRRSDDVLILGGTSSGARLFQQVSDPVELSTGTDLGELLAP